MTILFRYSPDKYSQEEVYEMFKAFKAGLDETEHAIAVPDDITIQKMNRSELIQLRQIIDKRIYELFYEPHCQQKNELGPNLKLACAKSGTECVGCKYFYSDDDARWL